MKICTICNIELHNHSAYANHMRWKHKDNTTSNFSEGARKGNDKRYGEWIEIKVKCSKENCQNTFNVKYRSKIGPKEKYFCSRSCANSRGARTDDFKNAVSSKVKDSWKNGVYDNIVYTTNKRFSSKKEREIVSFFKNTFPSDEWKSGGSLRVEDQLISRDLYSDKLKVCFEYDGIWHFKDINGQLSTKKTKDALLEKWCVKNGYRLIRLEDGFFTSFEDLTDVVYNTNHSLLKIGKSYK